MTKLTLSQEIEYHYYGSYYDDYVLVDDVDEDDLAYKFIRRGRSPIVGDNKVYMILAKKSDGTLWRFDHYHDSWHEEPLSNPSLYEVRLIATTTMDYQRV